MQLKRTSLLGALALTLALPAPAGAQACVARPGTAALDQYCETIPASSGQQSTRPRGDRLRDALPSDEVQRLNRHGDEGKAVLALPIGPKPPSPGSPDAAPASSKRSHSLTATPRKSSAPAPPATDAPPAAPSSNPIAAALSALGFIGSLGWALVVGLGVLAALAAVGAWSASRRVAPSGTGPGGRAA